MRRIAAIAAFALTLAAGIGLGAIGRQNTRLPAEADGNTAMTAASIVVPMHGDDVSGAERHLFPAPHTAIFMANELGLDAGQRRRLHELQEMLDSETAVIGRRIQA